MEPAVQFGFFKPVRRELLLTIRHVFSAEDPHFQHLFRGKFGFEVRMKILAGRFCQKINISFLHKIIHNDLFVPVHIIFMSGAGIEPAT